MIVPKVLVVAGTRPELQKLSTVIPVLRAAGVPTTFLWTGQHADPAMTTAFAEGLGWPEPDGRLDWDRVKGDPRYVRLWWHGACGDAPPAMVLVQGDTDSGVVGALALAGRDRLTRPWRGNTLLAHLEAGLRSWEPDLPEERNRRSIDSCADLLLCPSPLAAAHAKVDAKLGARIVVTGQTGLDALTAALDLAPSPPPVSPPYVLLTLHRAALSDAPSDLLDVLVGVGRAMRQNGLPHALWPVHPRLQGERYAACFRYADEAGIVRVSPLSYREMAARLGGHDRPSIVISDSGGLVEEACYLGIPTVIVRPATERWELVARGDADLVRPDHAVEALPGVVEQLLRALPAHLRDRPELGPYEPGYRPTTLAVAEIVRALNDRSKP